MQSAGLLFKALALAALAVTASADSMISLDTVTTAPSDGNAKLEPCPPMPPTPTEPITTAPPATTTPPLATSTPLTRPPANETTCATIENKDRLGFDLSSVRGDLKSCDNACKTTTGCKTWTWNSYNGGTCWLKSYAGKLLDKAGVTATECVTEGPSLVCNAFTDIDFVGMDVGNKPAKSVDECCDLCNEFSGCTAYAWSNHNGGTCWLKKSVGQVIANPGVISGSTVQLWGPVCPFEYDTDFEGNDIGNKPAKDAGVCCSLCKDNKSCKAYSWSNFNGGTCWMKSGKGNTSKKAGVISAKLA